MYECDVCMYVGVFSGKVYEKMPLKLTKLHSVSITTVTLTEKLVLCFSAQVYVCITLEHTLVHLRVCMHSMLLMPICRPVRICVCMDTICIYIYTIITFCCTV